MNLDFIKQIMSEFDQSNVTKMKVEIDDLKIELEKESEKDNVFILTDEDGKNFYIERQWLQK